MDDETLTLIIKATRLSLRLADDMQRMLMIGAENTIADEIAGFLGDALFRFIGEDPEMCDNFYESETIKLLKSEMPDGDVAREIMNRQAKLPAPNVNRPDPREAYAKNGGYIFRKDGSI